MASKPDKNLLIPQTLINPFFKRWEAAQTLPLPLHKYDLIKSKLGLQTLRTSGAVVNVPALIDLVDSDSDDVCPFYSSVFIFIECCKVFLNK